MFNACLCCWGYGSSGTVKLDVSTTFSYCHFFCPAKATQHEIPKYVITSCQCWDVTGLEWLDWLLPPGGLECKISSKRKLIEENV